MAIAGLETLFVTGGASGIGLAIAQHCAAEGMNVVLADLHRERLDAAVAAFAGPVLGVTMDVTSIIDWTRARREAGARFGAVDLLVNAAGIPPSVAPMLDMTVADFDSRIATNLSSVFYGVRTFGPPMRERGSGHIVNIASTAGLVPTAMLGDYGAAKYGVVGLSEILRLELADADVGVTVAAPGLTGTGMTGGAGMDVGHVARAIIAGVRTNAGYVVTHPEVRDQIEQRFAALTAAIGEPAEPGWAPARDGGR